MNNGLGELNSEGKFYRNRNVGYCSLEAIKSVKQKYFVGDDKNGFEPSCGILSVADGTMKSVGHLFASSVVNGGPAPAFLATWVYEYMTKGITSATQAGPQLDKTSSLKKIYDKVIHFTL